MLTNETLEGTSISGAHIGPRASKRAAAMLKDDALTQCSPSLTVGAEAANAIPVAVQLVDADGNTLKSSRRLLCQVFDANFEPAAAAALTAAETGTGTEVSPTAKAALLIDTDANGVAEVTVTDVSGALVGTVWLQATPVNGLGVASVAGLTFA